MQLDRVSRNRCRRMCTTAAGDRHRGFTLVECLVALSLLTIAGALLLQATDSTLATVDTQYEVMAARGLARQLIEEICNRRFHEAGDSALSTAWGPSAWESAGDGRSRFDDLDDYNDYRMIPPEDLWGELLGSEDGTGGTRHPALQAPRDRLDHWHVRIRVGYTDPSDWSRSWDGTQPSPYRIVRITVHRHESGRGKVRLFRLERVLAYSGIDQW